MITQKELIRRALWDAVYWQEGLADSYGRNTPESKKALEQARAYRKLIKKKYGENMTALELMCSQATAVSIFDIKETKK
ncbi:MAG: hypothetical protein P4L79_09960 [Legionella sp.]|uniref:hypothetical protein n=1 Tax=Legionella sp. TaxID=459 RepID=UPI00284A770A|nr:hypothetical protein [Legionella sp.]